MSSKKCPTGVISKSVLQEWYVRVSSKKCLTRVSNKSVLQERCAIVSSKGVLQKCHLNVSSQGSVGIRVRGLHLVFFFAGDIWFHPKLSIASLPTSAETSSSESSQWEKAMWKVTWPDAACRSCRAKSKELANGLGVGEDWVYPVYPAGGQKVYNV